MDPPPDQLAALGTVSERNGDRTDSDGNDDDGLLLEDNQTDESLIDEEESEGTAGQRAHFDSQFDHRESCYGIEGRTNGWSIDERNAFRDDDVGKGDDTGASRPQLSTLRLPEVEYDSAVGEDGAEACVDDSETHVSLLDEEELLDFFDIVSTGNVGDDELIEDDIESSWPSTVSLDSSMDCTGEREGVPTSLSPTNETGDFRTAKADRCYGRQTLLLSGDEDARFAGLLCQGFRF